MMRFSHPAVLFVLLFVTVYSSARGCLPYDSIQRGLIQSNSSFRRILFSTLLECAAECQQSQICNSFSFDLETRTCYLNIEHCVGNSVIPNDDYISGNIHNWTKKLSGPCSEVTCSDNTSCIVKRLLEASCEQESRGCGHPPVVENANMEYNGLFVGATVNYTCNKDFKHCHQNTSSRCQLNGHWDSLSVICDQSVWRNSTTPFEEAVPCGPTDSLSLIVHGTPRLPTFFNVRIFGEGDTLFLTSIRFNCLSTFRKIIINTRFSGKFGFERRLSRFPFFVGKKFNLKIRLSGGVYRLTVDDKVMLIQRKIRKGRKADQIRVTKDVLLHDVKIV